MGLNLRAIQRAHAVQGTQYRLPAVGKKEGKPPESTSRPASRVVRGIRPLPLHWVLAGSRIDAEGYSECPCGPRDPMQTACRGETWRIADLVAPHREGTHS